MVDGRGNSPDFGPGSGSTVFRRDVERLELRPGDTVTLVRTRPGYHVEYGESGTWRAVPNDQPAESPPKAKPHKKPATEQSGYGLTMKQMGDSMARIMRPPTEPPPKPRHPMKGLTRSQIARVRQLATDFENIGVLPDGTPLPRTRTERLWKARFALFDLLDKPARAERPATTIEASEELRRNLRTLGLQIAQNAARPLRTDVPPIALIVFTLIVGFGLVALPTIVRLVTLIPH